MRNFGFPNVALLTLQDQRFLCQSETQSVISSVQVGHFGEIRCSLISRRTI